MFPHSNIPLLLVIKYAKSTNEEWVPGLPDSNKICGLEEYLIQLVCDNYLISSMNTYR